MNGNFSALRFEEEIERVVDRHLDDEVDRDLEFARLLGEDQPRLVVRERVLLPVDEVLGRLDPQRIRQHVLRQCGAGRSRMTWGPSATRRSYL